MLCLNLHFPDGLSHLYQLVGSGVLFFIFIIFLIEIPVSKHCRHEPTPGLYGLTVEIVFAL